MKYILTYITLYYTIISSIMLFITIKLFIKDKLSFILIFILYSITVILFTFDILNKLDIISLNPETIDYLDQIDLTIELSEVEQNNLTINSSNIINVWLELFKNNNSNTYYSLDEQLKNSYYINKYNTINYNKINWFNTYNKYTPVTNYNKEIWFFIESFREILNELELIQINLSTA
uniref:hypothetical protein n=1 Tax=Pleurocordyceps sinensis TaxID=99896 RepID=UPI0021FA7FAD|nr:hypothetical protein OOD12_mgp17 [Pleurocordyceps sinensis]UXR11750.1 hypothetical protein [Pleurocordyceps sinensis]